MSRTPKLEAYWSEKNTQWESSGLGQQKFCEQQGLVYAQFTYWRGRLRQNKRASREPKLLKVLAPSVRFRPEVVKETGSFLEVLLPTGIKLYIKEEADIGRACALIQLLGGA